MRLPLPVIAVVLCLSFPTLAEPPTGAKTGQKTARRSRVDLANSGWSLSFGRYKAGSVGIEDLLLWSERVYDVERVTDPKGAQARRVTRLSDLEVAVQARVKSGSATELDFFAVQYALVTAQGE